MTFARVLLAAATLTLTACGPRTPGPHPNETMFWRITSSDVTTTGCTDDPGFRSQLSPIEFNESTYLMYRLEKDGTQATALECASLDSRSCEVSSTGIVYKVAGHELLYVTDTKTPIGTGGCQLQGVQSWTLTDFGETLSIEITNTLGLVDSPSSCPGVEEQVKRQSPNGLGVQGCIVKYTVGATIH
ncbi:MAG: hypothetical protein ACYC8T_19090 [Myxococcaceae bacterium]